MEWDKERQTAVIFLHIPKTAGTTLHDILDRHYAPESIHSFGADAHASVAQFKEMDEQSRRAVRLLRGHMAYGLHDCLPGGANYITVLREPVARVISYYNFIRRTPDHYLYDEVHGRNMSLHDLLQSGLPLMMNDGQVRLISGVWGDVGFGQVDEAMLRTAEKNLRDMFIVVGLTEQFDKSLLLLKERLRWQGDISYQRLNVSRQGISQTRLPRETLELIEQANRQDIVLYRFAKGLFEEQCRQQGALFPLRARLNQLRNKYKPSIESARAYSVRTKFREIW